MKKIFNLLLIFIVFSSQFSVAFADDTPTPTVSTSVTPTPDNSASVADLQSQIQSLQGKIADTQAQEKTLSSTIAVMNSQISLTQLRIRQTTQQVAQLKVDISAAGERISSLQGSLNDISKVLLKRIVATYEVGKTQQSQAIIASSNINSMLERASYMQIVQAHDKRLIYDTQQAQNDYANQKNILESKRKQAVALQATLTAYSAQLDQEQQEKKTLLAQTQGSEANYQRLLSQAKAQLAGFSGFTSSQGGSSLLSGQTVCDSWGCYYNQRDSQWGGQALNHTQYTVASDGCLLTAVAMVMTHYGKHVTPADLNANPSNFASYFPAYLLYTVSANGATASRVGASIDSHLSSSDPVIVGIRYSSGYTHFVVLVSGSNGNYIMNDPYVANGHNVSFTDHYSMGMIFEVDGVNVS